MRVIININFKIKKAFYFIFDKVGSRICSLFVSVHHFLLISLTYGSFISFLCFSVAFFRHILIQTFWYFSLLCLTALNKFFVFLFSFFRIFFLFLVCILQTYFGIDFCCLFSSIFCFCFSDIFWYQFFLYSIFVYFFLFQINPCIGHKLFL